MKKFIILFVSALVLCAGIFIYQVSKEKNFTAIINPNVSVVTSDSVYKDLTWQKRCSIPVIDEQTGKEVLAYFFPERGFLGRDWLTCRVGGYVNDRDNLGIKRKLRVKGEINEAGQYIILQVDPDYYKNNS